MALSSQHGRQCQAGPGLRKSWAGPQHPLPWLQGLLCPQQGTCVSQITHLDGILPIPGRASISLRRETQEFTVTDSKIWFNTFGAHRWPFQVQACDPHTFPNHLHTNSVNSLFQPLPCFSTSVLWQWTVLHLLTLANPGREAPNVLPFQV